MFLFNLVKITQSGGFRTSSIIQLENGDYVVLGRLAEVSLLNSDQFLLVRISENGDIVWSEIYDDGRILDTKQLFFIPFDNSIIALTEHSSGDFLTDNEYKIHKFSEDGNTNFDHPSNSGSLDLKPIINF